MNLFENANILITGGTGSLGQALACKLLSHSRLKRLIILSRDEMKQWEMQKKFDDPRIRFFIGDIRDRDRLYRALDGVNFVIHAAATKIVPAAEYNPFECIKTNVIGAMNLVDAAIDNRVNKVVALSTDKASSPINLYGASKFASDKIFVASNHYGARSKTRFSVVRYGNVLDSRGSIIPDLMRCPAGQPSSLTHPDMTRFFITMKQACETICHAFDDMKGGEIYVNKLPALRIQDLIKLVRPNEKIKVTGIRPGEKINEEMISEHESHSTYEFDRYFKILPTINNWHLDPERINNGLKVAPDFKYISNGENVLLDGEDVSAWWKEVFTELNSFEATRNSREG